MNMPKTMGDISMPKGGSKCLFSWCLPLYSPKNVLNTIIKQYTYVNTLAVQANTGNNVPHVSKENTSNLETFKVEVKNITLLKKPLKAGNPVIEKIQILAMVNN